MARKSKGRQKIEMTRMSKESNLLVTFSKRRSGLFKKAYELTTLCGAEIAIIVFSPGKKVFSFGHPDVIPVIDRFQNNHNSPTVLPPPRSSTTTQIVEAHRSASVRELNLQLEEMHDQLDMQKKHGDELAEIRKASQGTCWWEGPVNQLGLLELEQLKEAMEELKKNTAKHAEKLIIMEAAAAAAVASSHPNNCFLGGGTTSSSSSSRGGVGGGHVGTGFDPINVSPGLGLSVNPHGGNNLGGYGHGFF